MSYSDFKTLDEVKNQFNITVSSSGSLFSTVNEITPSPQLTETLKENVDLALNISTEKARSELILVPTVSVGMLMAADSQLPASSTYLAKLRLAHRHYQCN
jgi:hypothetical protein